MKYGFKIGFSGEIKLIYTNIISRKDLIFSMFVLDKLKKIDLKDFKNSSSSMASIFFIIISNEDVVAY